MSQLILKNNGIKRQDGAVLLVSMVILIVITLLAIQSSKTSMNDLSMGGNLANHQLSFISADNELQSVGLMLKGAISLNDIATLPSYSDKSSIEPNYLSKSEWSSAALGLANNDGVEALHFIRFSESKLQNEDALLESGGGYGTNGSAGNTYYLYRVTTMGFGGDNSSKSIISGVVAILDPDI